MQNKANLLDAQMNVSSVLTKYYENAPLRRCGENKPNQTQLQTQREAPPEPQGAHLILTGLTNQSISSLNILSSFCRRRNYGKKVYTNLDKLACLPVRLFRTRSNRN
jgi:hypothetical protein